MSKQFVFYRFFMFHVTGEKLLYERGYAEFRVLEYHQNSAICCGAICSTEEAAVVGCMQVSLSACRCSIDYSLGNTES